MPVMPEQSSAISTSMGGEEEWENRHRDQSLPSLAILS